jgi:hypothetical protein
MIVQNRGLLVVKGATTDQAKVGTSGELNSTISSGFLLCQAEKSLQG